MVDVNKNITEFIAQYTKMDVNGTAIYCPYWRNKIKNGEVTLRGFENGKGSANQIQEELKRRLDNLSTDSKFTLTGENLRKFAKREKIGIDCSGFAYRLLEELVRLKYRGCQIGNLSKVYAGGINRTNADTLTKDDYCVRILAINDYKMGDLIRINGGKHVAVIWEKRNDQLVYVHSHDNTLIQGVHRGLIKIIDPFKPLQFQEWLEKTKTGENFGRKRFDPARGDRVLRLRIFS